MWPYHFNRYLSSQAGGADTFLAAFPTSGFEMSMNFHCLYLSDSASVIFGLYILHFTGKFLTQTLPMFV